jgi:acetyl esterase/lipase
MLSLLVTKVLLAQDNNPSIPLWPNGAPGSESRRNEPETQPHAWSIGNIYNPSLTVYEPPAGKANGTGLIIAPGGGFRELVVGEEGFKPAKLLAEKGITCFVLKYRLVREENSGLTIEKDAPVDAMRAVRLVRTISDVYGIKKVGMLGFSAGGEVVSLATFQGKADPSAKDPIDQLNAQPDFAAWVYPGPVGVPREYKGQLPPAFMIVAQDDGASNVVVNLVSVYKQGKTPYEAHILHAGGHGFNMGDRSDKVVVKTWVNRLLDWMSDQGLLSK